MGFFVLLCFVSNEKTQRESCLQVIVVDESLARELDRVPPLALTALGRVLHPEILLEAAFIKESQFS